jgi:hypothetical protein
MTCCMTSIVLIVRILIRILVAVTSSSSHLSFTISSPTIINTPTTLTPAEPLTQDCVFTANTLADSCSLAQIIGGTGYNSVSVFING